MMTSMHRTTLAAVLLVTATALSVFAQGPLQKRVDFSINVPYAVRLGNYILPPGDYVLHQVMQNDLNLFSLHPTDLRHEPIAMIRTTRIDYQASRYPGKTKLMIETDETSRDSHPVLQGWTIPGMDGWEVISVVEKKHGSLMRTNQIARR